MISRKWTTWARSIGIIVYPGGDTAEMYLTGYGNVMILPDEETQ